MKKLLLASIASIGLIGLATPALAYDRDGYGDAYYHRHDRDDYGRRDGGYHRHFYSNGWNYGWSGYHHVYRHDDHRGWDRHDRYDHY